MIVSEINLGWGLHSTVQVECSMTEEMWFNPQHGQQILLYLKVHMQPPVQWMF